MTNQETVAMTETGQVDVEGLEKELAGFIEADFGIPPSLGKRILTVIRTLQSNEDYYRHEARVQTKRAEAAEAKLARKDAALRASPAMPDSYDPGHNGRFRIVDLRALAPEPDTEVEDGDY